MLELYIWGPAFGLPSFDAECIAATACLRFLLPADGWILVPAHDTSLSPTGNFPLLRDGPAAVAGFSAIVKYLSLQGWTLDSHLTPRQQADSVALSTHVTTHATPLLAHHLHTSPETYSTTILPAVSATLPRPVRYTLPACIHSTAVARATAAGLSYVDDTAQPGEQPGNTDPVEARLAGGTSPSLLFKRRETLQAALRNEQSKIRFRVEAALETLLDPLADKLKQGKQRYLVSDDGPTGLDCLTFGHLALLIYPKVQSSWLTERLRKRYRIVADYVDSLRKELLGGTAEIDAQVILASPSNTFFSLPWRLSPTKSTAFTTWTAPLSHLLLPSLATQALLPPSTHLFDSLNGRAKRTPLWLLTTAFTAIPALLGCVAFFSFQYIRREWVGWGGGERDKRFSRPWRGSDAYAAGFGGDAGELLSVLFAPPRTGAAMTEPAVASISVESKDGAVIEEL